MIAWWNSFRLLSLFSCHGIIRTHPPSSTEIDWSNSVKDCASKTEPYRKAFHCVALNTRSWRSKSIHNQVIYHQLEYRVTSESAPVWIVRHLSPVVSLALHIHSQIDSSVVEDYRDKRTDPTSWSRSLHRTKDRKRTINTDSPLQYSLVHSASHSSILNILSISPSTHLWTSSYLWLVITIVIPVSRAARITSHSFLFAPASRPYTTCINESSFQHSWIDLSHCGRLVQEHQRWIGHECQCCTCLALVSTTADKHILSGSNDDREESERDLPELVDAASVVGFQSK